jgi:hypothetical protein
MRQALLNPTLVNVRKLESMSIWKGVLFVDYTTRSIEHDWHRRVEPSTKPLSCLALWEIGRKAESNNLRRCRCILLRHNRLTMVAKPTEL